MSSQEPHSTSASTSSAASSTDAAPPNHSTSSETPALIDLSDSTASMNPVPPHADSQSASDAQPSSTSPKPQPAAVPASPTKSSLPPSRPPSQGPSHSQTSLSRRPSQLHSSRPAPLSPAPSRRASGIGIPTLGSPAGTGPGSASGSGGTRDRSESNASEALGSAGLGLKLSEAISASTSGPGGDGNGGAAARRLSQGASLGSSSTVLGDANNAAGAGSGLRRASSKAKTRPRSSLGTTVYSYATDAFHEADEGAKGDDTSKSVTADQARQSGSESTKASSSRGAEGGAATLAPAFSPGSSASGSGSGSGSGASNTHNAPSDLAALPIPETGVLAASPATTPLLPPVPSAAPTSPIPASSPAAAPPRHTSQGEVYIRDYGFPANDDRHLGIGRPVTPTPLSATARRLSGILFRNRSESQGSAGSDSSEGRRGWTGFGFSWRGLMNRKPRTSSLSQSSNAQEGRGKGGEMDVGEGERDEEYGGTRVDQSDDYAFESDVDDDDDDEDEDGGHGEGDRQSRASAHHLGVGRNSSGGLRYTPRGSRGGSRSRSRRASGIEGIDEEDEDDHLFEDEHDDAADEDDPAVEPVGLYRMAYTFEALGEHEMDVQEGQLVDVKGRGGGEGWCIAHRVRVEYKGEEVDEGVVRRKGRAGLKAAAAAAAAGQAASAEAGPDAAEEAASSSKSTEESTDAPALSQQSTASNIITTPTSTLDLSAWSYDEPEEGLVPESYLEKVRGKTREFMVLLKAEAIRREETQAQMQAPADADVVGGGAGAQAGEPGAGLDGKDGKTAQQGEEREEVKTVAPDGISEEPADMSDLEDSDGVRSR